MPVPRRGADQGPGQLDVAVREPDVFVLLALDATGRASRLALPHPLERGDFARAVALEPDSRFDRLGNRGSGPGEELIVSCRIQHTNEAVLIERHELTGLVEPAELVPDLE